MPALARRAAPRSRHWTRPPGPACGSADVEPWRQSILVEFEPRVRGSRSGIAGQRTVCRPKRSQYRGAVSSMESHRIHPLSTFDGARRTSRSPGPKVLRRAPGRCSGGPAAVGGDHRAVDVVGLGAAQPGDQGRDLVRFGGAGGPAERLFEPFVRPLRLWEGAAPDAGADATPSSGSRGRGRGESPGGPGTRSVLGRVGDEHRALRVLCELLPDRAEQQPREAAVPAAADDDELCGV